MTANENRPAGLPEELPHGEKILWQGSPDWHSLAVRAFHIRKIAAYFAVILIWRAALKMHDHFSPQNILADLTPLLLLALGSIGISALLAWIYSRSTTYTITNRRIFMRFGAALPMMLNLPFRVVGAAAAKIYRDGTADIPFRLTGPGRMAYLHLWPHARPWRLTHPEPMLRSIPDGARIADLVASALTAAPTPPATHAVSIVSTEPSTSDNFRKSTPFEPAAA